MKVLREPKTRKRRERRQKKLIRKGDKKSEQEREKAKKEDTQTDAHKEGRNRDTRLSSAPQITAERKTSNKAFVSISTAASGYFSLLAADIYGAWEWNILLLLLLLFYRKFVLYFLMTWTWLIYFSIVCSILVHFS